MAQKSGKMTFFQRMKVMAHKILYIDDNQTNLDLAQRILLGFGYEILTAQDADSGIEAANRTHPDIILMDINLPGIEGTEATARIKATPELAHIPVIAMTANDSVQMQQLCFASGCDAYLPKPYQPTRLLETIQQFVS